MSLKKLHISKMEPIKGDHYREHKDNVTYTSVNDRNQTAFSAVTAPNSLHSARLAQLAMTVQNKQKARGEKSKMPALIGSSSGARQQIEYRSEASSSESHRTPSFAAAQHAASVVFPESSEMPVVPQQVHPPVAAPATRMEYVENLGYVEVEIKPAAPLAPRHRGQQVAQPAPAPAKAPEVTRYTTDEKTGYKVKGSSGKLEVSAPHGSVEAWVFNEFAKANSQQDMRQDHGHERRLTKREHRSSSHSGTGFWQWVRQ